MVAQEDEVVRKACLGRPSEIEDHFDQRFEVREPNEPLPYREREDIEQLDQFGMR
jgi:hypothetical protein